MGSLIFTIGFQSFCITEVETFISYVNFHVSEVFDQDVILLQVRIQFSYLDITPCTTIISPGFCFLHYYFPRRFPNQLMSILLICGSVSFKFMNLLAC